MAYPGDATGAMTSTTLDDFVPELWSDEVIGAFKSNLVLGNLVTRINHNGKKGDNLNIPVPGRTEAKVKTAATAVTLNTDTATTRQITIDKHFQWSMLFEDFATVQALDSHRRFYTDDAGYALSQMVDWHLHVAGTQLQSGTEDTTGVDTPKGALTYDAAVIGGDGSTAWSATTTGNGSTLTDAGLRQMIFTLDNDDVPMSERSLIIPPVEKKTLLGIARFTEQAFVGEAGAGNSIRNGLVGDIYGVPVYVSTNCPSPESADSTVYRAGMLLHKSALVFVEQMAIRSQLDYQQQFLAELFTADTIYAADYLRTAAGIVFIVPST